MLTSELKTKLKDYVHSCSVDRFPDTEQCGLLYEGSKTLDFFPCRNIAEDKANFFVVHPQDYLNCSFRGDIKAVFHSHWGPSNGFSEYDKQVSEVHNLKSVVYLVEKDEFLEYEPHGYKNRYCGRKFIMGVSDCLTLIRDYYQSELGVTINDNLFRDYNSKSAEIKKVVGQLHEINPNVKMVDNNELQKNDILVFEMKNDYPHVGIYLGNNTMLHQKLNQDSCIEEFSDRYKKRLKFVFRDGSIW